MQEEIKTGINTENREKRKLNDAELAQVTGGIAFPWETCDQNCGACNVSQCPNRSVHSMYIPSKY